MCLCRALATLIYATRDGLEYGISQMNSATFLPLCIQPLKVYLQYTFYFCEYVRVCKMERSEITLFNCPNPQQLRATAVVAFLLILF